MTAKLILLSRPASFEDQLLLVISVKILRQRDILCCCSIACERSFCNPVNKANTSPFPQPLVLSHNRALQPHGVRIQKPLRSLRECRIVCRLSGAPEPKEALALQTLPVYLGEVRKRTRGSRRDFRRCQQSKPVTWGFLLGISVPWRPSICGAALRAP